MQDAAKKEGRTSLYNMPQNFCKSISIYICGPQKEIYAGIHTVYTVSESLYMQVILKP